MPASAGCHCSSGSAYAVRRGRQPHVNQRGIIVGPPPASEAGGGWGNPTPVHPTVSPSPVGLLAARGQVAVNKTKGRPIEKKGDTHGPLVPCGDAELRGRGGAMGQPPKLSIPISSLPRVLAIPVLTLEVWTWLMRRLCSGFTSTTILMLQRHCRATCGTGQSARPPPTQQEAKASPEVGRYHLVVDGHQRLQGGTQEVDPLAVTQGVLLRADDVDVVWDAGGGLVLCVSQAPRGQPGGEGAGWRCAAWGWAQWVNASHPPSPQYQHHTSTVVHPCTSQTCEALQVFMSPTATGQANSKPQMAMMGSSTASPSQRGPAHTLPVLRQLPADPSRPSQVCSGL